MTNGFQKLSIAGNQTRTLGFEKAKGNIIPVHPGQCPHCLRRMGEKGRQSAQVKVITAEGQDYWCQECVEKGVEEKICIKYRRLSKKEKKQLRKQLKKEKRLKENDRQSQSFKGVK